MAIFRKIHTNFWEDEKIIDEFTPEDKLFMLYLMTNPHTNQIGCYQISTRQMEFETGYTKETILKLIKRFEDIHKIIKYSEKTKEIFIINWYKYNWTKSPKVISCLKQEILSIKNLDFLKEIKDLLSDFVGDKHLDLYRMYNKTEISKNLANEIFERDNYTCQKCGSKNDLTIDHIIPRCLGGKNISDNLRVLCKECNSKRPTDTTELIKDLETDGYNYFDLISKNSDTVSKNSDTQTQEEEEKEEEKEEETVRPEIENLRNLAKRCEKKLLPEHRGLVKILVDKEFPELASILQIDNLRISIKRDHKNQSMFNAHNIIYALNLARCGHSRSARCLPNRSELALILAHREIINVYLEELGLEKISDKDNFWFMDMPANWIFKWKNFNWDLSKACDKLQGKILILTPDGVKTDRTMTNAKVVLLLNGWDELFEEI